MSRASSDLCDMKVLVVEDNLLVADLIADVLETHGCEVVGPVSRLDRGLALAEDTAIDGALLDINLAGDYCFPLAMLLDGRGIPFLFLSGYDDLAIIPPALRSVPRIAKPFGIEELAAAVAARFRPPADTEG